MCREVVLVGVVAKFRSLFHGSQGHVMDSQNGIFTCNLRSYLVMLRDSIFWRIGSKDGEERRVGGRWYAS